MITSAKLTEIRQLITKAKNEEAAQQLLALLEQESSPLRNWQKEIRNLLAQYSRAKQGQRTSTVGYTESQQSINKVTDGLLHIVDQIEQGKRPPSTFMQSLSTNWITLAALLALGISIGTFFYLKSSDTPSTPPQEQPVDMEPATVTNGEVAGKCPAYPNESPFNILILPYVPLDGQTKSVETALRIRLAERMEKYGIHGSVFTQMIDVHSPQYPVNGQTAKQVGVPCKAQLVIWGSTEIDNSSGNIITTTKFRFIESDNFRLTDLDFGLGTTIDTISNLSSIPASGELTSDIEQSLRLIFGLMAHETGYHTIAVDELQPVIDSLGGAAQAPAWGLIQADSYILSGQEEKALEIYRQMSERDTANIQALINKSVLEWREGNKSIALKDLDRTLTQDPQNRRALTNRAKANIAQHDVAQARSDVDALAESGEKEEDLLAIETNLEEIEAEEKAKYRAAEQQLESNPNDTSAWRAKAVSAANLGRYEIARRAAEQILTIDPTNETANATLNRVAPLQIDSTQLPRRGLRPSRQ